MSIFSTAATAKAYLAQSPLPSMLTGSYDLATVSAADLSALDTSKDPNAKKLAITLRGAMVGYADYLAAGARIAVTCSEANGGCPVLTLMGPGFDRTKPASVQTHYHGFSSNVAARLGSDVREQVRFREVQAMDSQVVFVLPQCKNAVLAATPMTVKPGMDFGAVAEIANKSPQQSPSYKTDWSNVLSEAQSTDDALTCAGITLVKERIVSAHSGGGAALQYAMNHTLLHDTKYARGVEADRIELYDCLYGCEKYIAAWGATDEGQAVQKLIYVYATNTDSPAALQTAFGSRYQRVTFHVRKDNPTVVDVNGKPIVINGQPLLRFAHAADGQMHIRSNTEYMHLETLTDIEAKDLYDATPSLTGTKAVVSAAHSALLGALQASAKTGIKRTTAEIRA